MDGSRARAAVVRVARAPSTWLAVAVATYALGSFVLANVRLLELNVTTWDFGIYQQALWSAAHGGPFYEAADWETGGFGSFLQVHSAFVLYLLVPVYRAFPSPEVLFATQSVLVALAAVPLYFLALDRTGSPKRALLAAVLFLLWAPTIAGSLFDFHIESFLPVELFTVALLYERRSYAAGLAVAALSFATMEVAPVLTFFLAVFFAWPTAGQLARLRGALLGGPRALGAAVRSAATDRRLVASLVLAVASVAAYLLLLDLRTHLLAAEFGFPPFPAANAGYVIGGTPSALGLELQNLSVGVFPKVEVWLVLYALVGFLPLLAPRSFVVAVPAVAFSVLSANLNYSSIGFQYGFVYAIPVFLGVAYALPRVTPENFPFLFRSRGVVAPRVPPGWRRTVRRPAPWVALALAVVALNVVVGPLDPALHGTNVVGSGYQFTYDIPPGYSEAADVAALVPAHATVVATNDLFPFVANSAIAYSFFWTGGDYQLDLPFSPTHLPDAVLIAQDRSNTVTPWIADLLYNTSDFGARAVAWSTPAGVVVLFLAHYDGPTASFGVAPPTNAEFGPGPLAQTSISVLAPASTGPYRTEIESEPLNTGLFVFGPNTNLSAGRYAFTIGVEAWAVNRSSPPPHGLGVLHLNGDSFGTAQILSKYLSYRNLSVGGWVNETFDVNVTGPTFGVLVRGYSETNSAVVAIGYLRITQLS
jgi:uncharacterized membrane protein